VYGDNFMRFDLRALMAVHERGGGLATIALFDPAQHANTGAAGGRAVLENGRVTEFVEGGSEGLVNAGAYCIEPELRTHLPHGVLDFGRDVLPVLARQGEVSGHVVESAGYCLGIDDPDRLAAARKLLRHGLEVMK
jgi:NDP-sugar pyrophosphorylase family protein